MIRIIGSFVSPYVRKVLACMNLKGLAYEVDPITPFYGNDEFERLSPLRRIPVLIDGDFTLSDSSVICAYLDEAYPGHPLLPAEPRDRARARWLEEFADTRLGDLFIWGLFYPKIVHPIVWGEPGDEARIEKSLERGHPRSARLSRGRVARGRLLVRRHRRRGHLDRELLSQRRLRRLRNRRRALAADSGLCRAGARPSVLRRLAEVRGCAAQRRDQEPPPGAPRRGRAADERNDGRARAPPRNDAPLVLGCRWPEIQCSNRVLSGRLRRDVARVRPVNCSSCGS